MKTSPKLPPNYEAISKALDVSVKNIVFTYGDTVYNVHEPLPEHLVVHEAIHAKQQINPSYWWTRYLAEPEFRYEQEVEAYRAQYQFIKNQGDRNLTYLFLRKLAQDFSSPMYGDIISFQDAMRVISEDPSVTKTVNNLGTHT